VPALNYKLSRKMKEGGQVAASQVAATVAPALTIPLLRKAGALFVAVLVVLSLSIRKQWRIL
jgi:hypothetical protein